MAFGLWTLQVAGTSQLLHTNIQTSEQQQCANPIQFSKKKLFLECSFSKSLFQKGTKGNFCSTGISLLSFESYSLEIQEFSDQVKVGLARQRQHRIFVRWIRQGKKHHTARIGTRMNSRHENPHDLLNLWVFRNGAKKTHLVPKGKNFLCVCYFMKRYNTSIPTRTELNCQSSLKKKTVKVWSQKAWHKNCSIARQ